MKVVFDFDDVLFDAKLFKQQIFFVLEQHGYKGIAKLYEESRSSKAPFSLVRFIEAVDGTLSFEKIQQLYEEIVKQVPYLLKEETTTLLRKLGKENCYIVSNGDEAFQMDKITRSLGLLAVAKVVIVQGNKSEALTEICKQHQDEDVIFVDDRAVFLRELSFKDCPNLKTVLFNEHGMENLVAEINDSVTKELSREMHTVATAQSETIHLNALY